MGGGVKHKGMGGVSNINRNIVCNVCINDIWGRSMD